VGDDAALLDLLLDYFVQPAANALHFNPSVSAFFCFMLSIMLSKILAGLKPPASHSNRARSFRRGGMFPNQGRIESEICSVFRATEAATRVAPKANIPVDSPKPEFG